MAQARFGHEPSEGERELARLYLLEQVQKALGRHARLQTAAMQTRLATEAERERLVPEFAATLEVVGQLTRRYIPVDRLEAFRSELRGLLEARRVGSES